MWLWSRLRYILTDASEAIESQSITIVIINEELSWFIKYK